MEKESKTGGHRCYNCMKYHRYYTKGYNKFTGTKYGRCMRTDKIVNNSDNCEQWRSVCRKHTIGKHIAMHTLNEILVNLSALRQIFEEYSENNHDKD